MEFFVLRRFLQALGLLLLVSMLGFAILHLAPGGPMSQFAASGNVDPADIARIEHQLGLDRPLPLQYLDWLSCMVTGDWGRSYRDTQPVLTVIAEHIGPTLELMITAQLAAILLGAWLGVLSAVRLNSLFDTVASTLAMAAVSIPTFFVGFVVIYIFSVRLDWLPAGDIITEGDGSLLDHLHHLIAPATVLAVVNMGGWSRYMRAAMTEVMHQDYVRTARSKGLPERRILVHHIIRNALMPLITLGGLTLPSLLGGALVTETVFTWPGMGRLFLDSISYRDYPVVMGILLFTAVLVLLGSLLADLFYGIADPRVRAA